MIAAPEIDFVYSLTDGAIAVNNLESARQQSWSRFWQEPLRPAIAECIVEQEQLAMQFLGDLGALDRLEMLVNHLDRVNSESGRTALIHAQVASMAHRFADARNYLAKVEACGEFASVVNRLSLSVDQACGTGLETVLETRQRMVAESGRLEDLVPLGALRADLREFDEADRIYQRALREYKDTSPVRRGMGLLSVWRLMGRVGPRATGYSGGPVVSEGHQVSARLCESARASGGDLFAVRTQRGSGGPADPGRLDRRP